MINKIILVGDVWKAPLERTTTKGETMCVLYLVTKEYQLDKNNLNNDNKSYTEKKEWHNIVAFGPVAQYILKNIHVGDIVYVEGQLQTREVIDGTNKKYLKDIIINRSGVVKKIYSKRKQEGSITLSDDDDEIEENKNSLSIDENEDLLF
jgi:single-strand DNA-binding protein